MKKLLLFLLILFTTKTFAEIPTVRFVQNKGQWEEDIKFMASIPGGTLQVRKQGLHYVFVDNNSLYDIKHSSLKSEKSIALKMHGLDVIFDGSNPDFTIESKNPTSEIQHYLWK